MERLVDSGCPRPYYQGDLCQCCQTASSVSLSLEALSGLIQYSNTLLPRMFWLHRPNKSCWVNKDQHGKWKQTKKAREDLWCGCSVLTMTGAGIWFCFFILYHLKMPLSSFSFTKEGKENEGKRWNIVKKFVENKADEYWQQRFYLQR